ncbi:uncharacterized protein LOC128218042 isoform X2 [Mya arenaria]|nr:uncharacterized protein LOC128218042 isoform X2 [Mya arenaria]
MSMLQNLPEALQEHIVHFTDDLVFKDVLRDKIIEKDCLSEEDCEQIDSKLTTRDQTRLLIKKLKDRGPIVIGNFLAILQEDVAYKHLAEMVNESIIHISEQYRDTQCVVCVLRTHVDVKDVGDLLWKNRVIPDRVWDSIVDLDSTYCNRIMIWDEIFLCMNACKNVDEVKDILIESIEKKYPDVTEFIKQIPSKQTMSCCCLRRRSLRQKRSNSYGSTSDISTTSEIPRGNLPSGNLFSDSDSAFSPSSMDHPTNLFLLQHSFSTSLLDRYDSIGSAKGNEDVQNTTALSRNRHPSEKFDPQESCVNEESDRCQSFVSHYGEGLPKHVPENMLNQRFNRSMSKTSNATLQAPSSVSGNESSIGEHRVSLTSDVRSSTSDKANSPEVGSPSHYFNVRKEEHPKLNLDNQDHETDDRSYSNNCIQTDNSYCKRSQSPKERLKCKCNSENDDDVFVNVDEDSDAHHDMPRKVRRRIKIKRLKIKTPQNTPFSCGQFVTRSMCNEEKVDPKIGLKPLGVNKSKKGVKRELRRQRSRQECSRSD